MYSYISTTATTRKQTRTLPGNVGKRRLLETKPTLNNLRGTCHP